MSAIVAMDTATDVISADAKRARLGEILRANSPLIIAYSGGVDSAFLLAEARRELGDRVLGVIADSPSLPRQSLAEAVALARAIGAPVEIVKTLELDNPDYAANPPNRCFDPELKRRVLPFYGDSRNRGTSSCQPGGLPEISRWRQPPDHGLQMQPPRQGRRNSDGHSIPAPLPGRILIFPDDPVVPLRSTTG